jgi:hypothetical protein
MRTSLVGVLHDLAAIVAEHRLNWLSVESVYVAERYISINVQKIEFLGELARRLRVNRKQITIEPYSANKQKINIEFRFRGIRWYCVTDAPRSEAELIGVDGEPIVGLPATRQLALLPSPKVKRKPAALIPPSLFGGDA